MVINLELSEKEAKYVEQYAKKHKLSLGKAIKKGFFRQVRDDKDYQEIMARVLSLHNNEKFYSSEEAKQILGF